MKRWVVAVAMTALGCSALQAVGGVVEDMATSFKLKVDLVDSSPYATGGEGVFKLKDGSGYIHVFTSTNGNFVVGEGSDLEGEVIVVGGGGAGGSGWSDLTRTMTAGGGGGGGGVRWEKDLGFYKGDAFTVAVGKGGKRSESMGKKGENGEPSSFEGGSQSYHFNVLGGGAGGVGGPSMDAACGEAGASGGGASGVFYSDGTRSVAGRPGLSLGYGKNGGAAGVSQYPNRNHQDSGWIVAAGGGGGADEEGLPGTHGRTPGTFQSGGAGRQIYTFFDCGANFPFAVGGGGAAGSVGVDQGQDQNLIGQFLYETYLINLDVSGGTSFANHGSQGSGSGKDGYGGGGAGGTGYHAVFLKNFYLAGNGGSGVVLVRYKPVSDLCKHDWVNIGVPTPKNCTEDGTTDQKCSICEKTRTLIDPATGHKWNDQGVCSVCGALQPCAVCQWEDRGYEEGNVPTCTTDGVMKQECSVCHSTRKVSASALGHDWADPEVLTPAYCESAGTGTRTCNRCAESEEITVKALGHQWLDENWNVIKEPNCTDDGSRENRCTRQTAAGKVCGKAKTEVIPALGHDFDEDSVCRRCGISEAKSRLVQDLRDKMRFWEGAKEVRESPYATGGDMILKIAGKENEYIHIFSDPNAVNTSFVVGDKPLLARTLVAGGGGGGGFSWKYQPWNYSTGGGGGGGEVKVGEDVWLAAGQTYTATVGAGGAAGPNGEISGPNVLKSGASGESTTFSGGKVSIAALGGGGGGSASTNQAACCGKSLATGGGAAACILNWGAGSDVLVVGTPGKGSIGGDGGNTNAVMNVDGTAYTFTMGGGGGGAGEGEAANGRDGSAALADKAEEINPHGGVGIHSDILGYDLGFGGGGGGGALVAGQGVGKTTHYGVDGGGTSDSYYQAPSGGLPVAPTESGYSGYGGGGAGAGMNGYVGDKTHLTPGGAGGAGVVIIRYRELGIDPTYPLVTLTSAEATSETTVDINWRLRDFGEGKSAADLYLEYGRADGKEPKKQRVKIQTVTEKGATGTYALTGLLPGRPYTFKVSAANGSKEAFAEEVFTFDMPGGKSVWENASAMQDAENYHIVKFSAKIGYVGEETSKVTFRWKQDDEASWHEESVGEFSRANPPPESGYSFEKLFLTLSTVDYEFIVKNDGTGGDIKWEDAVAGKCALTKGVLTEAYWQAKTINIRPEVDSDQSGTGSDGRETLVFTHDQDPAWGSDKYKGKDTFRIVKPTDGDHEGRPLLVGLHGRGSSWTSGPGADGVYHVGNDFYYMALDNTRGDGNNKDHDFLYWWGATPTHRGPESGGISNYREENAISRRVLDCVEWAIRTYKIDRNRVYICGNSMGGQGALAIGLPHGEVFAAIEANVPATIWYPCARMNFVDNSGKLLEVAARDASLYNDPPPVLDWSGANDIWSRDHHVLLDAMNRFRYACVSLWGTFHTTWDRTGHESSYANARKYNDLVGRWDFFSEQFRKNLAYPVFTNAKEGQFNDGSINNIPPWPWAMTAYKRNTYVANDIMQPDPNGTASGSVIAFGDNVTTNGQRNFFFRWENGEDSASGVSMKLWVATADEAETAMFKPPTSAEVDVTLRRIQGFGLRPGQPVTWSFGKQQNVAATADSEGLVTVRLTLTNEHQTFTLKPGTFADLTAEVDVLEVQERAISIVADVLSLGGAPSAAVSVDYTDEAGVTTTKALGTQGAEAKAYTFGGLQPGKAYDVVVKVGSSAVSLGTIKTKYYPLAGTATVTAIGKTSFSLQWNCERIGTEATGAKVTVEWRREGDKAWTLKDEATITAPGPKTFDFTGLDSDARYMARVTFTNGIDPDVFVDLGEFLTLCDGEKRFVEVPAIPNLVATGAAQRPTLANTADYTVTKNEAHSAVGTYEVELTLTQPSETRWIGAEGATIKVRYEIVAKIAGISVPSGANVETYTRMGDTYVIFHAGTDVAFTLDFDSRADILLVGGGGAGGRASNWDGGNDNRDGIHKGGVGAGGGAGGMREFSNVYLFGGTYKVSVGEGAVPAVNNATRGVKGGSSSIVGGTVDLSVSGGGSGGHASTQIWSGGLAMGVKGASSGGSLLAIGYGHAPSMNNALGLTYFIEGEGNFGGRVGGYIEKGFWGGGVGGGGAGAPGAWVEASKDFGNECYPGGIGRISRITGDEIYYAGGGASGSFAYPDKTCAVEGTLGGGGASSASAGKLVSENGADGLGGGGAGGSYCNEEMCEPGRGGRGIVIVRLLGYSASDCEHTATHVSKPGVEATCETPGVTPELTCDRCGKVVASPAPIAALGHDYDHTYDYSIGGKGDVCTRCHQVSPFTKIARLYFSDDRRHVFLNGHRGLVSEKLRIPENSLAAIKYAIEMGVESCELDPKITHDGVIVLSHDANPVTRQLYNFTPTHDADNYIVGSGATANWYGELEEAELRVSDNINEGSGEKVARLEDVLDLCKDKCLVNLDCNWWTVDANKVVKMIRDRHMEKQCVLWDILFTMGNKPMPDDLLFQVNDPRPGAWGGSLDQNEPEGQNDSSSHPNPDRFGWERKMNVHGATSFMTNEPLELMDYLKSIGRRSPDWEIEPEDQRARPTVLIPAMELKRFVKGQPIKYGIQETDDWRVISDGPDGGDPERNEYFFELELKDPGKRWANGDFKNTSNLRKKFWYYAEIYDEDVVSALPTDFVDGGKADKVLKNSDSIDGLSWTGATRAYQIGDETVLIFADTTPGATFTVDKNWDMSGKALLVAGGGPGGLNSSSYGQIPGAGGGAGGMLETPLSFIKAGTYAVTVGAGGAPVSANTTVNVCGGDSFIADANGRDIENGTELVLRAFGGGGGGHGCSQDCARDPSKKVLTRGVNGGSSGGSMPNSSYGWNKSIEVSEWLESAVAGQGNPGGRIGGNTYRSSCNSSVGGGGASLEKTGYVEQEHEFTTGFGAKFDMSNEPSDDLKWQNRFTGGGQGRASDITGSDVTYAGGGAGGSVYSIAAGMVVKGGNGGGGCTDFSSHTPCGSGVNMLGGGGAGQSIRTNVKLSAGAGGSGIVILRVKTQSTLVCDHANKYEKIEAQDPLCTEDGWTREIYCPDCGRTLEKSEPIPAHGHDFKDLAERVPPTLNSDGYELWDCAYKASEGCTEQKRVELPRPSGDVPTDMPEGATALESGDFLGLEWTDAAGAWQLANGDVVLVFTDTAESPTFTIEAGKEATADMLLVGGGGAGSKGFIDLTMKSYAGPGGGAGGCLQKSGEQLLDGTYTVTIGRGGEPATANWTYGENGGDTFLTREGEDVCRAIGGGAGGVVACGDREDTTCSPSGRDGGSGGGAAAWQDGESGEPGHGIEGQGNAGGVAAYTGNPSFPGVGPAGGGGAGRAGCNGEATERWYGGAGGDGIRSAISGLNVWYAGGGAAGSLVGDTDNEKAVPGGQGGGGSTYGYQAIRTVTAGVDSLGGGGAGAVVTMKGGFTACSPTRGGSGVVVIHVTALTGGCAHVHTHTTGGEAKDATCTEDGFRPGVFCDDCDKQIVKEKVLPKLGHDFSVEVPGSRVEPTEDADGQVTWKCSRCEETQVETLKYDLMFQDGETVLWLGDSISDLGYHIADIYRWYLTHEPTRKIRFVNAGISGETAELAFKRCVDGGVATLKPDSPLFKDSVVKDFSTVVLMFAINDLQREEYQGGKQPTDARKEEVISNYVGWMTKVIDYLQALPQKPRVFIGLESPYDDSARGEMFDSADGGLCENFNATVTEAVGRIRELAKAKKCPYIDFNTPMNRINAAKQALDPSYSIIGADRVHPSMTSYIRGKMGRYVMMAEFLHAQKASPVVTDIAIDAAGLTATKQDRATVSSVKLEGGALTFRVKPQALPMAFPRDLVGRADYNDAMYHLRDYANFEQLAVSGLDTGVWTFEIESGDGAWTKIGDYSAEDLAKGVQMDYLDADSPQLALSRNTFNAAVNDMGEKAWSTARVPPGTLENNFARMAELQVKAEAALLERTYRLTKTETPEPVKPRIDRLPTDYANPDEEYAADDEITGLAWTGAARAYRIGDETVVIYSDTVIAKAFEVKSGYQATVSYLAVGGGGAGGSGHRPGLAFGDGYSGAGGGAGGVASGTGLVLAGDATYTVTVGKGGKANATQTGGDWLRGENGGSSSLISVTEGTLFEALGGGAGGTGGGNPVNGCGKDGGCGGGACYIVNNGSGTPGNGTDGQGYAGGTFPASAQIGEGFKPKFAGGGGGAGGVGGDARIGEDWLAGIGGAAVSSSITGEEIWYAGGGAGGANGYQSETKEAAGGIGGGSSKVASDLAESGSGVDSLGGGGAGAAISVNNVANPGNGGSGVVVIRVTKLEEIYVPHDLPTVNGQPIEPGQVFELARTDRPIVYPSAPRLINLEDGRQQIEFGNPAVDVPRYYRASLQNEVEVVLVLNEKAIAPLDTAEPKPFDVGATSVSFALTKADILPNIFYGVKKSADLMAPKHEWLLAGELVKGDELLREKDGIITIEKLSDEKQFYRLCADDVPPGEKVED